MMYALYRAALVGVAVLAIAGCRLIDQRSFEPAGIAPDTANLARSRALAVGGSAGLLVTTRPGDLTHDWRPDVLAAVRDALVRTPDAAFDIVTPVPVAAGQAEQTRATTIGAIDAAAVAELLQANGVAADRLHLAVRGDPGAPAREVRVYLR